MTRRDIVRAAARGERVPRQAVTPYIGNFAAALVGTSIDDYCTSAELLAATQIEAQSRLGQDALVAQSDGYYMAEALGMETVRRKGTTPAPARWPITDLSAVATVRVPDPRTGGRMPVYLDAISRLRRAAGNETAVRACGTGPFSLAGHLLGPDTLVTRIALLSVEPTPEDEKALRQLLEICTETTTLFATAALQAGADIVMCGDSLASLDMISPDMYRSWVWEYEKAFFDALRPAADRDGAATLLHICGNTTPILREMAATGAHILEIDWKVSLADAAASVLQSESRATALMGNLDPTAVLLQGTPADVESAAAAALHDAGEILLLGSGCEVAPATPLENMAALVHAVGA